MRRFASLAALAALALSLLPSLAHATPRAGARPPATPASWFELTRGRLVRSFGPPSDAAAHAAAVRAFALGRATDAVDASLLLDSSNYFGEHVHKEIELDHRRTVYGVFAHQTIYPDLREPRDPSSAYPLILFAPTMFGPGLDCIEAVTAYPANARPEIWAWDWCKNISGAPEVTIPVDAAFVATYANTMPNGLLEYTVQTTLGADGKTWTMSLYDYKSSAWDTVYATSGSRTTSGFPYGPRGWDMYEMYSPVDTATNVATGCAPTASPIGSNGVALSFVPAATRFVPASKANARFGRRQNFHCPNLTYHLLTPFSDWNVTD